MTAKKKRKKKPLTNTEKIAIASLILGFIKWLVELLRE